MTIIRLTRNLVTRGSGTFFKLLEDAISVADSTTLFRRVTRRLESFLTSVDSATATYVPGGGGATFDFYLSPTGNDTTGDGSLGNPWAITAISSKAATIAGNTVGLLDGTYRITSGGDDEHLINIPSTAAGVTIEAVNPRLAIITTNNGSGVYPQGTGGIAGLDTIRVNADGVTFKNIKFFELGGNGITLQDVDNILIEGCWFADIYGKRKTSFADDNLGGIFLRTQATPKTNVTIRNCLFEDIFALNQTIALNDSCGIGSMFGAENWVIENCTFKRMGKPAFLKGQCKNFTARYNFVHECSGWFMGASTANTGNVSNNYVYGNAGRVNWLFGANSANTQGDAADIFEMYNNTIIIDTVAGTNSCDFGYMNFTGGSNPQAMKFYNNAIFMNAGFGLGPGMMRFPPGTEAVSTRVDVFDYNRYSRFQISDDVGSTSYSSVPWATIYDTHSSIGSLGLVDVTGDTPADFEPDVGSALLGAGTVDGIGGAACDIGWTRYATVGHDW